MIFECLQMALEYFASEGSMKIEKTPLADVWDHKICLVCRTMLSLLSTDRYDPKETFQHICWVLVINRKIFHDTQSQTSHVLKSFFDGLQMTLEHLCL